ncbi:MAG: hypothetical protein PVJ53_10015 [Desulfobacterales bacterium]
MHMVVGFILASLLRKKARIQTGLPSIRGKLEAAHALPGRLRFISPLLEGLQGKTLKKIGAEIKKIDGIERVDINGHTGSLLIVYDPPRVEPVIIHGIVIKVLGLEDDLEKSPDGLLTREIALIGRSLNQQIYQSSSGLMDLRSSLMISVLMLALYRIVIQGDRTLPGGINLLWWTYVMAKRGQ